MRQARAAVQRNLPQPAPLDTSPGQAFQEVLAARNASFATP